MCAAKKYESVIDLCQRVEDCRREAACRKYEERRDRELFERAGNFAEMIESEISKLKEGKLRRQFDFAGNAETFLSMLTISPSVEYMSCFFLRGENGYELDDDGEETAFVKEDPKHPFLVDAARVKGLDIDHLVAFLVHEAGCSYDVRHITYEPDAKNQCRFYRAFMRYLETAAAVAKGVGSGAARRFLEAHRILDVEDDLADCEFKLMRTVANVTEADIAAAYRIAAEAHAELYVDLRLAAIKPICPKKLTPKD